MKLPRPELRDQLAGEYVLGTLRGPARRRFERWLREHPVLRERVQAWEHKLVPMAAALPPRPAPANTWDGLEARLFGAPATVTRRGSWAVRVATAWAAVATLSLATVAGMVWLTPERLVSPDTLAQRTQKVPASYVAVLSDAQGQPALVVSAARHANVLELKALRPGEAPPGTRYALWAHTEGGRAFLLGRIDLQARDRIVMTGSAEQTLSKVATLSITAEPAQVEPLRPTQVALWAGPCVKVW